MKVQGNHGLAKKSTTALKKGGVFFFYTITKTLTLEGGYDIVGDA